MPYKDLHSKIAIENDRKRQERRNKKYPDYHKEYSREWRKRNKDYFKSYYSDSDKLLKRNARLLVNSFIRKSKLERLPCIRCGGQKSEAHHEDYSKPLEIVWLCKLCHSNLHRKVL